MTEQMVELIEVASHQGWSLGLQPVPDPRQRHAASRRWQSGQLVHGKARGRIVGKQRACDGTANKAALDGSQLGRQPRDPSGERLARVGRIQSEAAEQGRDRLVANAIPRVGVARVARIDAPSLSSARQVLLDVTTRRLQHRLHPDTAPRTHSTQTSQPSSSNETKQDGLELIVRRVGRENRAGAHTTRDGLQELPSKRAQPGFSGQPATLHSPLRIPARAVERQFESLRERAHDRGLGPALVVSKTVIQVCDVEPSAVLVPQRMKGEEQRRGVGAAAHRDDGGLVGQEPTGPGKRPSDRGLDPAQARRPRAVRTWAWWRRRDSNPGHRDYDSPALPAELRRPRGAIARWRAGDAKELGASRQLRTSESVPSSEQAIVRVRYGLASFPRGKAAGARSTACFHRNGEGPMSAATCPIRSGSDVLRAAARVNWTRAHIVRLVVVQILALAWGPGAASAIVSEERGVRRVLIGVGSTWSERDGYHDQARFGAMLGFEANLNRNLAMGFLGDITSIDDIPDGNHYRLLTGLDLKLLPLHGALFVPG
jgi:hypothetical protein